MSFTTYGHFNMAVGWIRVFQTLELLYRGQATNFHSIKKDIG